MTKSEGSKKPGAVRRLWEWWKVVARKIGDIQARIILAIFYFVILGPFVLAIKLWADPLAIKAKTPRGWLPKDDKQETHMERATKQF